MSAWRRTVGVLSVTVCCCSLGWAGSVSGTGQPRGGEEPASQASVTIWATGDGVRVNPETGKYFEDRTDIHADYPTGKYWSRNPVWDAAGRRVTLQAARNEFVAFQVVVESRQRVSGVSVRFDTLRGPGGAAISGRNVGLFKAWYVHVKQPSSDFEKTRLGTGWYPDALPDERHLRGDIWNGSLRRMDPDLELRYYHMARRHRFLPGACDYRPGIKVRGTEVSIDWAEYDKRVGTYIDGTAFTDAQGYWGRSGQVRGFSHPGMAVPLE